MLNMSQGKYFKYKTHPTKKHKSKVIQWLCHHRKGEQKLYPDHGGNVIILHQHEHLQHLNLWMRLMSRYRNMTICTWMTTPISLYWLMITASSYRCPHSRCCHILLRILILWINGILSRLRMYLESIKEYIPYPHRKIRPHQCFGVWSSMQFHLYFLCIQDPNTFALVFACEYLSSPQTWHIIIITLLSISNNPKKRLVLVQYTKRRRYSLRPYRCYESSE